MIFSLVCSCTRTMRNEPGKPAGYMVCGCGRRVLVRIEHERCQCRTDDGELCRQTPVLTVPIALCRADLHALATTEQFRAEHTTVEIRAAWDRQERSDRALKAEQEEQHRRRLRFEQALLRRRLSEQGQVYYIALRGCIKIGYTGNMKARMAALVPDAVLATEPGDPDMERRRHQEFAHLRAPFGAEYFSVHPQLLAHIETILINHGPPNISGYPAYETWHLGDHMLVTVQEAAQLAGVSERTVYAWVKEERMTSVQPDGKKRGIRVNALEAQELAALRRAGRLPRVDRPA